MCHRRSPRRVVRWLISALLLAGTACTTSPKDPRPSFLVVVFDTLRKDAVSAYGEVDGTTPNLDRLARDGLLFPLAFAPSPWTLPSHATLLTGLPPERHGVGMNGQLSLPDGLTTLAERMRQAGYQTAGFSENPLVGAEFGLSRGFDSYRYETIQQRVAEVRGATVPAFDVVDSVARWAEARPADRPFFVFVNLFDPHDPYAVRDVNPFLPPRVDAERAKSVQPYREGEGAIAAVVGICDRIPPRDDVEILRGLYLGEVAVADAKLARIREILAGAGPSRALVTVATSDHGEHLGEHRLLGHEFSVRNVLLNVPLVVHGLPGVPPGVRDEPVELADLAASILDWAGIEVPKELSGRPLPVSTASSRGERAIVGAYSDDPLVAAPGEFPAGVTASSTAPDQRRRGCGPEDRVFGATLALTRYPHKLIWFEGHPSALYDLSWDPGERSDRASYQPELAAALEREMAEVRRRFELAREAAPPAPSPAAVEALRGLGYVE